MLSPATRHPWQDDGKVLITAISRSGADALGLGIGEPAVAFFNPSDVMLAVD